MAMAAQRVATADSNNTFERSPDGAIFLNGLDKIAAAGRCKATDRRQQRTNADLVETHARYQAFPGQQPQKAGVIWRLLGRRLVRHSLVLAGNQIFLAALRTSLVIER